MNKSTKIWLILAFVPSVVLAHGGGLDASGCHTNRKTGNYHCHGGKQSAVAPRTAPDKIKPDKAKAVQTVKSAGVTCHVGPRGGTYTITASGRKNYKGC